MSLNPVLKMDPPADASAVSVPSCSTYASGHFTASKAGMGAADPAHIAAVIEAASKGSKYYANAQAREQQLEEKIHAMKAAVARLPSSAMLAFSKKMEAYCMREEERRDLTSVFVHVDFDAFFCSVSELADPTLRGTPFAVGSLSMISTASYAARAFGVRSAMPGFVGKQLCPALRFVKHDGPRYEAAAAQARAVFAEFDPHFSAGSLDEASLDLTTYLAAAGIYPSRAEATGAAMESMPPSREKRLPPTAAELIAIEGLVTQLRARVRTATGGLTCSAGVAPNRMLAKICSDMHKPDGQTVCPFDREGIIGLVHGLPARKIPGVGRVTERELAEFGVASCGDIIGRLGLIRAALGERAAQWLARCALGLTESGEQHIGATSGGDDVGRKSISQERTFAETGRRPELRSRLAELAAATTAQLREERLLTGCVTVKLKLDSYEVLQHGRSLQRPTDDPRLLADTAAALLRDAMAAPSSAGGGEKRLRLLGIRYSALQRAVPKATLLDGFLRHRPRTVGFVDLLQDDGSTDALEGDAHSPNSNVAEGAREVLPGMAAAATQRPADTAPTRPLLRPPTEVIEIDSSDEDTAESAAAAAPVPACVGTSVREPENAPSIAAAHPAISHPLQRTPAPHDKPSPPNSGFLALCPVCGHLLPAHLPELHIDGCLQRRKRKRQIAAATTATTGSAAH